MPLSVPTMKVSADNQLARPLALDLALLEAGVELLRFSRNAACSGVSSIAWPALVRSSAKPALVARAEALVVEDLLDRDRRQAPPFQRQELLEPVMPDAGAPAPRSAPPPSGGVVIGWLFWRSAAGPSARRGPRAGSAVSNRRTRPVDPAAPAGLGDVAEPLGQLQHRQLPMHQLDTSIYRILGRG